MGMYSKLVNGAVGKYLLLQRYVRGNDHPRQRISSMVCSDDLSVLYFFPLFPKEAGQVQAFLRRYSTKRRKQLVLAIMLISAAVYALLLQWSYYDMSAWSTGLPSFWQTLLDYRTYNFVMYFFYFMLGAVCAYMTDTWRGLAKQTLPWNVFVFIGLFMLMGHTMLIQSGDTINLNISTYLKPSTFVLIVSQLLLLYGLLLHLQKIRDPSRFAVC